MFNYEYIRLAIEPMKAVTVKYFHMFTQAPLVLSDLLGAGGNKH
jgi:hypothetical protein